MNFLKMRSVACEHNSNRKEQIRNAESLLLCLRTKENMLCIDYSMTLSKRQGRIFINPHFSFWSDRSFLPQIKHLPLLHYTKTAENIFIPLLSCHSETTLPPAPSLPHDMLPSLPSCRRTASGNFSPYGNR